MSNIFSKEYNPFNKYKVLCHYDRMVEIDKWYKGITTICPAPVNIALDFIYSTDDKKICGGFKCSMCMSDRDVKKSETKRIPKEKLLALPNFFRGWGVKSLCLAGHNSDPSLYHVPTQIEFLRRCKENNIEIGYVSNGAYLVKELMETLCFTPKWTGFSVNAGNALSHKLITGTDTYDKVMFNMNYMSEYIKSNKCAHTVGYKFLILPENYDTILEGVKNAIIAGANLFQLRPADMSNEDIKKIDIKIVEEQMQEALVKYSDKIEFYGIKEKFNTDLTKRLPKRCIASPLGSTWMGNGEIVLCPDTRWKHEKEGFVLGNFIEEDFISIINKWNGEEHRQMINNYNKDIHNCMRCTSVHFHELYENVITKDNLDLNLI